MDFEEWLREHEREVFKRNQGRFDKAYVFGAKNGFKSGQQSKQAEIDGLEKKLKYEKLAYKNIKLQLLNKQDDLDELQAEIDALKAKLEDITKWAELHIKDYNSSESESEHDRGWFNAACQVLKKVKGD